MRPQDGGEKQAKQQDPGGFNEAPTSREREEDTHGNELDDDDEEEVAVGELAELLVDGLGDKRPPRVLHKQGAMPDGQSVRRQPTPPDRQVCASAIPWT